MADTTTLDDLEFGETETGGSLKSTYSLATARFAHSGKNCIALEWFHRTGHPFKPYASLILIAEECDKTSDAELLRSIAPGAGEGAAEGAPRAVFAPTLGRKVLVLDDQVDRSMDLAPHLDTILDDGAGEGDGGAADPGGR